MTVMTYEDPALPEALNADEASMQQACIQAAPSALQTLQQLTPAQRAILRWRKQPNVEGDWRVRMVQDPRGWDLWFKDKLLVRVRPVMTARRSVSGWYWASEYISTASTPLATPDAAKEQGTAHALTILGLMPK